MCRSTDLLLRATAGERELVHAIGLYPLCNCQMIHALLYSSVLADPECAMSRKRVFKNYTQRELDDQYDQRTLVPDISDYVARWARQSEEARTQYGLALDRDYAEEGEAKLDVFGNHEPSQPLVVYFHGGAWRDVLSRRESAYPALALVPAGVKLAVPDFSAAPSATLDQMITQCRSAVAWLVDNAAEIGIDVRRIHVCGHSSGAHLAAMVALTDWPAGFGLPADTVAGLIAVSGVYDLHPVRLSARNDYLRLDVEAGFRASPIQMVHQLPAATVVAFGENELDEFKRQAEDFSGAARAGGKTVRTFQVDGANHFDMADALGQVGGPVYQALVEQVADSERR